MVTKILKTSFLVSALLITVSCTSQNEEETDTSLNTTTPIDTSTFFFDPGSTTSTVNCTGAITGTLTRLSPVGNEIPVGSTVNWYLQLDGCPNYRIRPLFPVNGTTHEFSGSNFTFTTTHTTETPNLQQIVWVEGLNSDSGLEVSTQIMDLSPFAVGSATVTPGNWTCNASAINGVAYIPTYIDGSGYQRVVPGNLPPQFSFNVNTSIDTRIVDISEQTSANWQVLNYNMPSSAGMVHNFSASVSYLGNVPIQITVANENDSSDTKVCNTVQVQVIGVNQGPQTPPPAPSCNLEVMPAGPVQPGQLITVRIISSGYVNSAVIAGQAVSPQGAVTYRTYQVGRHEVRGSVMGPGGQVDCPPAYYDVVAP